MRLRFALGLIAVILLAAGSVVTALIVRSNEEGHFDELQREEAHRSARQAAAVAQLSVGELASAAAFFQAEGSFNRHEFEAVGNSLLSRGALTATAYLQRVRGPERASFEAAHGVQIFERGPAGLPRRAVNRPEYFPVAYAVAEQGAKSPFGFDVASDPERGPYLRPRATEESRRRRA